MVSNREAELKRKLLVERWVLFACTVMIGLSIILWVTAICTDWWFTVSGGEDGIYVNETKRFFLYSNSGLWGICRTSYANTNVGGGAKVTSHPVTPSGDTVSNVTTRIVYQICTAHEMFPTDTRIRTDPSIDKNILIYNRSEASFSIISLMLMILGFIFSVYTFRNPRYMFKRLAGLIHLLAGACVYAVIQVLISSIDYEKKHLPFTFPRDAIYSYDFSFVLAWLVLIMLLVSGIAFLIYSGKRTGNRAPNEEIAMADEPTIIGR